MAGTVRTRWLGRLAARVALEKAARARHIAKPTPESRALLEHRKAQVAYARRVVRRHSRPKFKTALDVGLKGFEYKWGAKGEVVKGAGHYSAGGRAKNLRQLVDMAAGFHAYHKSIGYGGLSYEVLIADDGSMVFGNPMDRKSAGVASNNTGLVNICCPGTTGDRLTAHQVESIRWLMDNWHTSAIPARHRLPVPARSIPWKGHREWNANSACPGAMLPDYKRAWS